MDWYWNSCECRDLHIQSIHFLLFTIVSIGWDGQRLLDILSYFNQLIPSLKGIYSFNQLLTSLSSRYSMRSIEEFSDIDVGCVNDVSDAEDSSSEDESSEGSSSGSDDDSSCSSSSSSEEEEWDQ